MFMNHHGYRRKKKIDRNMRKKVARAAVVVDERTRQKKRISQPPPSKYVFFSFDFNEFLVYAIRQKTNRHHSYLVKMTKKSTSESKQNRPFEWHNKSDLVSIVEGII